MKDASPRSAPLARKRPLRRLPASSPAVRTSGPDEARERADDGSRGFPAAARGGTGGRRSRPPDEMVTGYGAREVARMLGLSAGQVRSYVRAGFLDPSRSARGEMRFSFSDLVLLRAAKGLVAARIPSRRVKRALARLRAQLPEGRSLRDLHIRAEGDRIVVGDGARRWSPEDGQVLFDFGTAELARRIAPLARKAASASADDFFERGCDLEEADPA